MAVVFKMRASVTSSQVIIAVSLIVFMDVPKYEYCSPDCAL